MIKYIIKCNINKSPPLWLICIVPVLQAAVLGSIPCKVAILNVRFYSKIYILNPKFLHSAYVLLLMSRP